MPSPERICAMAPRIPLSVKKHYESAPKTHQILMLKLRKDILEIVPGQKEKGFFKNR
jgi:hypothetical protein